MTRPIWSLALLTTVLSKAATTTGSQSHKGHETIWITRILTACWSRIIQFEAPRAVLRHTEHIYDRDKWIAFKDRLATLSALDGASRDELALILAPYSCRLISPVRLRGNLHVGELLLGLVGWGHLLHADGRPHGFLELGPVLLCVETSLRVIVLKEVSDVSLENAVDVIF